MDAFSGLAKYYDAIYYRADIYETEANVIARLIEKHRRSANGKLLDVACGTGTHIKFLLGDYCVFGLDLAEEMLQVARAKHPDVRFYSASMIDFDIPQRFGAIICLYGSIGFVQTVANLQKTLQTFATHLDVGGVLVLVPWSSREEFNEQIVSGRVKTADLHIARMEKVERSTEDRVRITYHFLIGEGTEVKYYTGEHPAIGLFSLSEYRDAIIQAGLEIVEIYRGQEIHMGMAYVCRLQSRRRVCGKS